jgi:hypothetical protein
MSEENHIIPKHLDDPPMYLMWDADEAYAFLGPVFVVVTLSPSLVNFLIGGGSVTSPRGRLRVSNMPAASS